MACQVAGGPFRGSTSDLQLRLMDCIPSHWPISGGGEWRGGLLEDCPRGLGHNGINYFPL